MVSPSKFDCEGSAPSRKALKSGRNNRRPLFNYNIECMSVLLGEGTQLERNRLLLSHATEAL